MHVFDHTIKPILLYGCEIWGTFNAFSLGVLAEFLVQKFSFLLAINLVKK
jgi:uncharacterized membrane protein YcfT